MTLKLSETSQLYEETPTSCICKQQKQFLEIYFKNN